GSTQASPPRIESGHSFHATIAHQALPRREWRNRSSSDSMLLTERHPTVRLKRPVFPFPQRKASRQCPLACCHSMNCLYNASLSLLTEGRAVSATPSSVV